MSEDGVRNKHNRFFLLIYTAICLTVTCVFAQVQEQSVGETKENAEGGYDFYNSKTKQKTGSSRKLREDIFYYDSHGNLVGRARKDKRNKRVHNYYNADGVKVGILRKKVDGSYSYMDDQSGQMTDARPLSRGDIGSLPPQTFVGRKSK
ncbi:MAG: hypothetical protein Q8O30_12725 [Candidatus Omnitrophota bacterium]|nr:hypothetical protein [Candidatus Omnitrophota bacterium]